MARPRSAVARRALGGVGARPRPHGARGARIDGAPKACSDAQHGPPIARARLLFIVWPVALGVCDQGACGSCRV
jgi:hypothetical protein